MRVCARGPCASATEICQRVCQMKNDKIAGTHTQIGRFAVGSIGITIARGAVRLRRVTRGQFSFKNTILTAQIFGFLDRAARLRTWTRALGRD